jgi:hypothetical protein
MNKRFLILKDIGSGKIKLEFPKNIGFSGYLKKNGGVCKWTWK